MTKRRAKVLNPTDAVMLQVEEWISIKVSQEFKYDDPRPSREIIDRAIKAAVDGAHTGILESVRFV